MFCLKFGTTGFFVCFCLFFLSFGGFSFGRGGGVGGILERGVVNAQ